MMPILWLAQKADVIIPILLMMKVEVTDQSWIQSHLLCSCHCSLQGQDCRATAPFPPASLPRLRGSPDGPHAGRRPPFRALTRMGSLSWPSGMAERFILAMCCSVARAACVFPVETLNRADSGINWWQRTWELQLRGTQGHGYCLHVPTTPSQFPGVEKRVASVKAHT